MNMIVTTTTTQSIFFPQLSEVKQKEEAARKDADQIKKDMEAMQREGEAKDSKLSEAQKQLVQVRPAYARLFPKHCNSKFAKI